MTNKCLKHLLLFIALSSKIFAVNPSITLKIGLGTEYTYHDDFHEPLYSPFLYSGNIGCEIPPLKFLRLYQTFNISYYSNWPVHVKYGKNDDGEWTVLDRYYDKNGKYRFYKYYYEIGLKYSKELKKDFRINGGIGFYPFLKIHSKSTSKGEVTSEENINGQGFIGLSYILTIEKQLSKKFLIYFETKYIDFTKKIHAIDDDYSGINFNIGFGYKRDIKNF